MQGRRPHVAQAGRFLHVQNAPKLSAHTSQRRAGNWKTVPKAGDDLALTHSCSQRIPFSALELAQGQIIFLLS
jgi:hypothetical protein